MKCLERTLLYTGVVLALLLAFLALSFCCPRMNSLGFDYMGIIVGILSFLVTILIAWNIFYAIDLKKDLSSKIEERYKENQRQLQSHSRLNQKEMENILRVLERSDNFCKKLDDCLLELLTQAKKEQNDSEQK